MNDNNKIDGGYILLARAIQCSGIWEKPSDWLKIWTHILLEVRFSDHSLFRRGENLFTFDSIARSCRVSYSSVDHCVRWLRSARQIATRKTTRGIVIFVEEYAKYQDFENYKSETKSETLGETEARQKRHYNRKNEKNEKNIYIAGSPQSLKTLQSHLVPLALWSLVIQPRLCSPEEMNAFIKRNLRASQDLCAYPPRDIILAALYVMKDSKGLNYDPTLETVGKKILVVRQKHPSPSTKQHAEKLLEEFEKQKDVILSSSSPLIHGTS